VKVAMVAPARFPVTVPRAKPVDTCGLVTTLAEIEPLITSWQLPSARATRLPAASKINPKAVPRTAVLAAARTSILFLLFWKFIFAPPSSSPSVLSAALRISLPFEFFGVAYSRRGNLPPLFAEFKRRKLRDP